MSSNQRFQYGPPPQAVCPHCFRTFKPSEVLFMDDRGETHEGYLPGRLHLKRLLKQPTAPVPPIGTDGQKINQKVCPHCEERLPYTAGTQKDMLIGLVGARRSGKTQYLASLIPVLQRQVGAAFHSSLLPVDQRTADRYHAEFEIPTEEKLEVPATDPFATPLIYNWKFDAAAFGERKRLRAVTLALYDTAGENFDTADDVANRTAYLAHASGLLLLIDPLHIEEVRQRMPGSVKLPELGDLVPPRTILAWVVGLLQQQRQIAADQRIDIPVAVVLTKCDALEEGGLVDADSQWADDVFHEGQYNLTLHDDVSGMFSALIQEMSPAAHSIVQTNFADVAFFGTSATGCSADEAGSYKRIAPRRTQDPVLWLLHELGIIPGA